MSSRMHQVKRLSSVAALALLPFLFAGPSGAQTGFQPSQAVRSEVLAIATLEGTYSRG